METKHTKGEWLIEIDHPESEPTAENKCHMIEIRTKTFEWICSVMPYGKKSKEETEANAKLIAAAPDLLEALIEALPAVEELNGEFQEGWEDTINKIKKAIKKATE
jgi:hypothetical protein